MTDALDRGFRLDDRLVEPTLCRISGPAGEVRVEPRAMEVLVALARSAGKTVGRDELIEAVWKHPHVTDDVLSRCISMLRQALGDDKARPRYVETIPKRGYRLIMPVKPGVAADAADAADAAISLAVLPFLNLSGDPGEEHIADGVTELLITHLALMPALRVISRTSAMHYKGTRARLTEIARELDVSRIVEGSVLRSGRQMQVVVQLIDPATDMHLFTRTYTRELTDLLKLQNEIVWQVAEEIGAVLRPGERSHPPSVRQLNEDATQAYLRARYFWAQRTPDGFDKAIREYEACLSLEPEFSPAYAGLADTLIIIALHGLRAPSAPFARARELVDKALALDSRSAEALCARGGVALFHEWDFDAAEGLFRRALEINPSHDVARLGLGDALMYQRDFDAGLRELHTALRVNPFDLGLQMNLGDFLLWARRPVEGIAQLQRTLDMGSHFWPARFALAEALASLGDRDAALRELARAIADAPAGRMTRSRAFVHATLDDRETALALLREMEVRRAQSYAPAADIGLGYAALGDTDQALRWIDAAIDERSPRILNLGINSGYDRIRGDRRFAERLARIGLTR
jgi:TolB-like protein/Tfp pilus assembly protein PilF